MLCAHYLKSVQDFLHEVFVNRLMKPAEENAQNFGNMVCGGLEVAANWIYLNTQALYHWVSNI